jgi:hypothetical protein
MAYRTYAITFRPTDGITDEQIDVLDRWMQKACDYYAAITEKTGKERHLHAALFLTKSTTRSNLHNRIFAIKGIDGTLTSVEKSVFRRGTKIMYNSDFMEGYMTKGDDTAVISMQIPDDDRSVLDAYFPEKDDDRMKRKFEGSVWFLNMEKAYYADEGKHWFTNPMNFGETAMAAFIHHRMYVSREIEVIADSRRLAQYTKALVHFVQKLDQPHPSLKKFLGEKI